MLACLRFSTRSFTTSSFKLGLRTVGKELWVLAHACGCRLGLPVRAGWPRSCKHGSRDGGFSVETCV